MKSFDTNSHKHFWIFLKAQHMFLKVNTHTAHTRSKDKHTTLKHMFACYTILFSSHYVHFLLLDCGLMRWTRGHLDFCYFQCCASGMIYSGIRNDLFRNLEWFIPESYPAATHKSSGSASSSGFDAFYLEVGTQSEMVQNYFEIVSPSNFSVKLRQAVYLTNLWLFPASRIKKFIYSF